MKEGGRRSLLLLSALVVLVVVLSVSASSAGDKTSARRGQQHKWNSKRSSSGQRHEGHQMSLKPREYIPPADAPIHSTSADSQKQSAYIVLLGEGRVRYSSSMTREVRAELRQQTLEKQKSFRGHAESLLGRELQVFYHYTATANGFATHLTENEARELRSDSNVYDVVSAEGRFYPTTWRSTEVMGAQDLWAQTLLESIRGNRGEGLVAGIIDTGIYPEHPSFADDDMPLAPWVVCQQPAPTSSDAPYSCNNKLIGLQYFVDYYLLAQGGGVQQSVREGGPDVHGTHTASTFAGNYNVPATVSGLDGRNITGVAPRAHIAMYKACGDLYCTTLDLVAAIDKAVADGVDVISFSIGGTPTSPATRDALAIAFLAVFEAGIPAAVAAGNDGPDSGTTGTPAYAPWVTAVGAALNKKRYRTLATLTCAPQQNGDGGPPPRGGPVLSELVELEAGGLAGANTPVQNAPLFSDLSVFNPGCNNAFLPGQIPEGSVVVCPISPDNNIAAVTQNAAAAGGVLGMVVLPSHYWTDYYDYTASLPYVTFFPESAELVNDCINRSVAVGFQPTISWEPSSFAFDDTTEQSVVGFSSRGPAYDGDEFIFDYIKPDVVAPGVNILAAWNPADTGFVHGETFISIEGTSMSTPHAAGAMLLLKGAHPDWSPANIQSALMSTATLPVNQVSEEDGSLQPTSVFDRGSGAINALSAYNAGLLFDYSADDFRNLPFSEVNLASIFFGEVASQATRSRTLRSSTFSNSTWNFFVTPTGDASCAVYVVDPVTVSLEEGEAVTLTVSVDVSPEECEVGEVFEGTINAVQRGGPGAVHIAYAVAKAPFYPESNLEDLPSFWSQDVPVSVEAAVNADEVLFYPPLPMQPLLPGDFSWPFYGIGNGTIVAFSVPFGSPYIRVQSSNIFGEQPDVGLLLLVGNDESSLTQVASSDVIGTSDEVIEYWVNDLAAGVYWVVVYNNQPPTGQGRLEVTYLVQDNEAVPVYYSNTSDVTFLSWEPSTIPLYTTTYGVLFFVFDDEEYYQDFLVTVVGTPNIISWSGSTFPVGEYTTINITIVPPPGYDGEQWVVFDTPVGLEADLTSLPPNTIVDNTTFPPFLSWVVDVVGTNPITILYQAAPVQGVLPGTEASDFVYVQRPDGSYGFQEFSFEVTALCGNGECELTEDADNCPADCGNCNSPHDCKPSHHREVPDAEFNFFFQGLIPQRPATK